jgi:hypothetical protein
MGSRPEVTTCQLMKCYTLGRFTSCVLYDMEGFLCTHICISASPHRRICHVQQIVVNEGMGSVEHINKVVS